MAEKLRPVFNPNSPQYVPLVQQFKQGLSTHQSPWFKDLHLPSCSDTYSSKVVQLVMQLHQGSVTVGFAVMMGGGVYCGHTVLESPLLAFPKHHRFPDTVSSSANSV